MQHASFYQHESPLDALPGTWTDLPQKDAYLRRRMGTQLLACPLPRSRPSRSSSRHRRQLSRRLLGLPYRPSVGSCDALFLSRRSSTQPYPVELLLCSCLQSRAIEHEACGNQAGRQITGEKLTVSRWWGFHTHDQHVFHVRTFEVRMPQTSERCVRCACSASLCGEVIWWWLHCFQ